MLVKTSELIGPALDWVVAQAIGNPAHMQEDGDGTVVHGYSAVWSPSTDWSQGGPLIEKYQVATIPEAHDGRTGTECSEKWYAVIYYDGGEQYTAERCDSPLIAACRAIVAAKLGDQVDVPDELMQS